MFNQEDKCKKCGSTNVDYIADGCSCHLDAPCSGCVNAPLVCKDCNHKEYIEQEYEPVSQTKTDNSNSRRIQRKVQRR